MTLWFGPFVDLRPDAGYFHLCPACYREHVKPHLDDVQGRLAELHPLARHLGLQVDPPAVNAELDGEAAGAEHSSPDEDSHRVAAGR